VCFSFAFIVDDECNGDFSPIASSKTQFDFLALSKSHDQADRWPSSSSGNSVAFIFSGGGGGVLRKNGR
jgi:hypothetical protein